MSYNKYMKTKAVICDLDGTLCDAKHRLHHIKKNPKDWDSFFKEADKDLPNQWCLATMQALQAQGFKILFVTGRRTDELKVTIDWIKKHTPFEANMGDNLFMRASGDRREDTVVKKEIYHKLIEPNYEVLLAIDDRTRIFKMWRSLGIPALLCDNWED